MHDPEDIEDSFRVFFARLNKDALSQNEARIILVGNKMFYGFLNIVFDFPGPAQKAQGCAPRPAKPANILDEISKTDSKAQKTIKVGSSSKGKKKRSKFTQSAEGNPSFTRANFISKKLYRNHFLCSLLSDLLVNLFLPQRCRHYLKFQRGGLTSAQGHQAQAALRGNEHRAAPARAPRVQVQA